MFDRHPHPFERHPHLQHTAVTRSHRTKAPVTRCNAHTTATSDLLNRISGAFDPAVQREWDEERAEEEESEPWGKHRGIMEQ
jgi:hypothetical protein